MGFLLYLFFMLATAANLVGPVLAGRPLPWLALQLLAVATVTATLVTARSWQHHLRGLRAADHVRLATLVVAGAAFLSWAVYWGLLIREQRILTAGAAPVWPPAA